jgi:hypothetical protein
MKLSDFIRGRGITNDLGGGGGFPTTVNAMSGTGTATLNNVNRISASSNFTVTIPDGSANTDLITVAVTKASTGLVTISGKLRGNTTATRVMWAGESFTLRWNTTLGGHEVVASVIIPMIARIGLSADQIISHNTPTKILLDRSDVDNTGLMVDTTNHQLTIKRDGIYKFVGKMAMDGAGSSQTAGSVSRFNTAVFLTSIAGTQIASGEQGMPDTFGSFYGVITAQDILSLSAAAVLVQMAYQSTGVNANVLGSSTSSGCSLIAEEIPIWP